MAIPNGTTLPTTFADKMYLIKNSTTIVNGLYYKTQNSPIQWKLVHQEASPFFIDLKTDSHISRVNKLVIDDTVTANASNKTLSMSVSNARIELATTANTNINSTTAIALPWNLVVELAGTVFSYSNVSATTRSRIAVLKTGKYEFQYTLNSMQSSTGNRSVRSWLRKNGTVDIDKGSAYSYTKDKEVDSATNFGKATVDLVAGDYVEVITERVGNSGVLTIIAAETSFEARFIKSN
jgi:hypothetical protein